MKKTIEEAIAKFEVGKTYSAIWTKDDGSEDVIEYTIEKRSAHSVTINGKRYMIPRIEGRLEYPAIEYIKITNENGYTVFVEACDIVATEADPAEYAIAPEAMEVAINAEIDAANNEAKREQIFSLKSDIRYREGALKDLDEKHIAKHPNDESLKELRAEWTNELSELKAELAKLAPYEINAKLANLYRNKCLLTKKEFKAVEDKLIEQFNSIAPNDEPAGIEFANSDTQTSTPPVIDIADYNTLMTWAEKVSNGQSDAVTPIKTYLEKFGYIVDKQEIFTAINTGDLNGFRRYINKFPFLVKDNAGYLQKLYSQEDGQIVLAEIPIREYPNAEIIGELQSEIDEIKNDIGYYERKSRRATWHLYAAFIGNRAVEAEMLAEDIAGYENKICECKTELTAKEDDFQSKLAELKAAYDAATAKANEADEKLFKAREAVRELEKEAVAAEDVKFKAKCAYLDYLREVADDLTARLITPDINKRKMLITTQSVTQIEKSLFGLRVDVGYKSDFTIKIGMFKCGDYDTPAQVEKVIGMLKAAIARGDKDFIFPTFEDLSGANEKAARRKTG